MTRTITVIFLLLLLRCNSLLAQPSASADSSGGPISYGLRAHYSYLFVHVKDLLPDDNYFPRGVEASVSKMLLGKKAWDQCNCYPKTGLILTFFDYDNPKVLGQGYSASWFIEPVFKAYNRISLSTRGAIGLAILSKPYHPEKNPQNQAYSMYLSGYLLLNVGVNWRMNDKWLWNFSLNANHNSNGGIKDPNKGLNFPSLSLGFDYTPKPEPILKRERTGLSKSTAGKLRREVFFFIPTEPFLTEKKSGIIFTASTVESANASVT